MIPPRLEAALAPASPSRQLATLFGASGHELYLVGGSVRDALLDRPNADLDFATDATPDVIEEIVRPWAGDVYVAGKRFGTIGVIREGNIYEITTFRSEVYRDDSRKPEVVFSESIEEDLFRRDFTINAMGIGIPGRDQGTPEMIDPTGGLGDLQAGLLRTPLDPEVSFGDDPLRMLRLFRFVSTLGFAPSEEAVAAVHRMHDRLDIVSAERIRGEFDRLIVGDDVGTALVGLVATGLAGEFIQELPALALESDPIHHHKDVLTHTIAVVEKTSPRLRLRLAALFHDVGKPDSFDMGPISLNSLSHKLFVRPASIKPTLKFFAVKRTRPGGE